MAKADLHVHSTASDGLLSPTKVVEAAARAGLGAVALADHDTVGGLDEAMEAGRRLGVEVVPAVELNTDFGLVEIHILGYFFDWKSPKLLEKLAKLRHARVERGRKMVEKLRELGVPLTMERVLEHSGGGSVGRPHVAHALVEMGAVPNTNEAFNQFLVRGAPAYVARTKMTPVDAVNVIMEAGGVAGIAHPAKAGRDRLISDLVKYGLGAIEAFHIDHGPDYARHYQALARRFGLIPTGGSDAHGFDSNGVSTIGNTTVDMEIVELLREAAPAANA